MLCYEWCYLLTCPGVGTRPGQLFWVFGVSTPIWRFPKMVLPPNHPNGATMFVLKPMVLGIILRKPPCMYVCMYVCICMYVCMYVCIYIYITKIGLDQIKSKSVCFFVVNAFFICTYCCYSIIISKIILEQVTLFPWPILDTRQTYPFPAGLAIIHHYSQEWSWNILQHV